MMTAGQIAAERKNPYRELNGIRFVKVEPDYCEAEMEVKPEHLNLGSFVHGGALFTMADCVSGIAAFTDGRQYVTQSAHINFIKNVQHGKLTAQGRVLSRGRKIVIVQVDIWNETGMRLVSATVDMYCTDK